MVETIIRRRAKAVTPPPPVEELIAEEKPSIHPEGKIDIKIKLDYLPEMRTEGKKVARFEIKNPIYGFMRLECNSRTYRKCLKTIQEAPPETKFLIVIEVPYDRCIPHHQKIVVAKGCGLQVFEKKPKAKQPH